LPPAGKIYADDGKPRDFCQPSKFRYNWTHRRSILRHGIAPLAQLDRASGYEPEGRKFESSRAHHFLPVASYNVRHTFQPRFGIKPAPLSKGHKLIGGNLGMGFVQNEQQAAGMSCGHEMGWDLVSERRIVSRLAPIARTEKIKGTNLYDFFMQFLHKSYVQNCPLRR
jgi:hypothetical protein